MKTRVFDSMDYQLARSLENELEDFQIDLAKAEKMTEEDACEFLDADTKEEGMQMLAIEIARLEKCLDDRALYILEDGEFYDEDAIQYNQYGIAENVPCINRR